MHKIRFGITRLAGWAIIAAVATVTTLTTAPAHGKDFGVVVFDRSTEVAHHQTGSNQIILKNRDNFEGDVTVDITVDPPVAGLEPNIRGADGNTFTPGNQVLTIDASPRQTVSPGQYTITVTVTGEKNGRPVERIVSYTLTITEPPEFGVRVQPGHIVIKQGQSGTTDVVTTFKKNNEAMIQLEHAIHGGSNGLSAAFSGGGWQQHDLYGNAKWLVTRDPDPEGENIERTRLTISASPETPPGQYTVSVLGTYNSRYVGAPLQGERTVSQGATVKVTVVADPQYAHLQDPPNFDLFATEEKIIIPAGGESAYYGRETEVGVWGDRWNSSVKLAVTMREPSGGITVGLLGGNGGSSQVLKLPTNNRAYGRSLAIVVPEGTEPGSYFAVVTATSKALSGKTLTREVDIEIIVPAARPTTGSGGALEEPLSGLSVPDGQPIDEGYPQDPGANDVAELVEQACRLLSEAADTIACSVHTFKKPDLGSAKPAEDVTLGETTAVPDEAGGGFDTEVFIRNPEDNNLRKGCGDLNESALGALTGFNWGPADLTSVPGTNAPSIVTVACNAAAQSEGGRKAIIRQHRDQVTVDLKDRKKADYKRKEDRNHVRLDDSNKHLIVRDTVNDAVFDSPASASCAPAKPKKRTKQVDVALDKVPENASKFTAGAVAAVSAESSGLEKLDGALTAVDRGNELLTNLGTESKDLKSFNAAAKFGRNLADLGVKSASGEAITTQDLKSVSETVADLTGNKHVKTVSDSFDALLTLESLKLKIENGEKIQTSDITGLVEKLDTVRGDRFAGLGEVLGGIKKNAERITKAEDMIAQMEKVSNFLDKAAEGQNDSVKAFEAFSDYLEMLGSVAEKVPGMGEFMAQYAKAVKNMEGDVKTIADAVRQRNEAIAQFDSAVEGYDYDKLLLDADQFEEDYDTGGGGRKLSADQINVNRETAPELERAEDAQRFWRDTQKCIIAQSARMKALKNSSQRLIEEYKGLPNQTQLDQRAQEARNYSDYVQAVKNDASKLTLKQAQNMGFSSIREAEAVIVNPNNTARGALDRADAAEKSAGRREFIKSRLKEIRKEWQEAKKKREDCLNRLQSAELAYWQALREYVKEYSWYSVYLMEDKSQWRPETHKRVQNEALSALDAQIAAAGFQVNDGTVEIIVVDECDEQRHSISVGG